MNRFFTLTYPLDSSNCWSEATPRAIPESSVSLSVFSYRCRTLGSMRDRLGPDNGRDVAPSTLSSPEESEINGMGDSAVPSPSIRFNDTIAIRCRRASSSALSFFTDRLAFASLRLSSGV